jgi:hypothetical protein
LAHSKFAREKEPVTIQERLGFREPKSTLSGRACRSNSPDATPEVAVRGRKSFPKVQDVLKRYGRLEEQLEDLKKAGCDRAQLLTALDLAFLTDESWESLLGMSLKEFKAAIQQIKDCADTIADIENSHLIWWVSLEIRDPSFVATYEAPTLSVRLSDFARELEKLRSFYGPKHKPSLHTWKAHVVAMVIEATKKPHDPEVSALISAVTNNPKYSEKRHGNWRRENQELIELHREKQRERRLKGIPPPPPPR